MIESNTARWIKYFIPSYLYAAFIFIVSSIPLVVPPVAGEVTDEFIHFIEYGIFGFLLARSFRNAKTPFFQKKFLILAIIAGVLYGISDEYHQVFVPHRGFEIFDLMGDIAGTALGAFTYRWTCRKSAGQIP